MYRPQLTYSDPKAERKDSFIRYFGERVNKNNKNFLCAVTGQTGSGKSWASGSIAEKYAKEYNINYDPNIHNIFSLKALLDLINRKDLDKILPFGSVLLFDEPQVSVNSRDWRSEANQILSTLTSTFRNMRLIIFFATPYLEFIDKQSRILFHAEIEIKGFDKTTNLTLCKPRLLEWNARKNEFYKKRLIIRYPGEVPGVYNWYYLQYWKVTKPSKEWVNTYEEAKLRFTKQLNKELQQQYEYMENISNKGRDLVTLIDLYEKHGLNYRLFAQELPHLSPYALERLIAMVKKQEKAKKKQEIEELKEIAKEKPVLTQN